MIRRAALKNNSYIEKTLELPKNCYSPNPDQIKSRFNTQADYITRESNEYTHIPTKQRPAYMGGSLTNFRSSTEKAVRTLNDSMMNIRREHSDERPRVDRTSSVESLNRRSNGSANEDVASRYTQLSVERRNDLNTSHAMTI